jgi:hypothetical protein
MSCSEARLPRAEEGTGHWWDGGAWRLHHAGREFFCKASRQRAIESIAQAMLCKQEIVSAGDVMSYVKSGEAPTFVLVVFFTVAATFFH